MELLSFTKLHTDKIKNGTLNGCKEHRILKMSYS